MKPMTDKVLKHRVDMSHMYEEPHGNNGAFLFNIQGNHFFCIISDGGGWDHVSISIKNRKRTPTWDEMCLIKDIFFEEDETVVQFHPPKKDHVNIADNCLHLWRYQGEIPRPPSIMVGPSLGA